MKSRLVERFRCNIRSMLPIYTTTICKSQTSLQPVMMSKVSRRVDSLARNNHSSWTWCVTGSSGRDRGKEMLVADLGPFQIPNNHIWWRWVRTVIAGVMELSVYPAFSPQAQSSLSLLCFKGSSEGKARQRSDGDSRGQSLSQASWCIPSLSKTHVCIKILYDW